MDNASINMLTATLAEVIFWKYEPIVNLFVWFTRISDQNMWGPGVNKVQHTYHSCFIFRIASG